MIHMPEADAPHATSRPAHRDLLPWADPYIRALILKCQKDAAADIERFRAEGRDPRQAALAGGWGDLPDIHDQDVEEFLAGLSWDPQGRPTAWEPPTLVRRHREAGLDRCRRPLRFNRKPK
jgi:hypothetical protein